MRSPPQFDAAFRERLEQLFVWRRDVRRFKRDPVDSVVLNEVIRLACMAPSVGYSQPWRFVLVEGTGRREAIRKNFERCNRDALMDYQGQRASLYASLKLAGLDEAPVHLAVFADEETAYGCGLGRKTMPEMLHYSVVTAVNSLWLAARAWGIGVGWVSILDPAEVSGVLDVPASWSLVAYLCIGYPQEEHPSPELQRRQWEGIDPASRLPLRR